MKIREIIYIARRWRTILVVLAALSALAFVILLRFANLNDDQDLLDRATSDDRHDPALTASIDRILHDALSTCRTMFADRFYLLQASIQHQPASPNIVSVMLHGTEQRWALFPTKMECRYDPQLHEADGTTLPGGLNLLGEYRHVHYPDKPSNAPAIHH